MSWQEEAKGLPLWPGAFATDGAMCVSVEPDGHVLTNRPVWRARGVLDPTLDLSHPDTRAAFDRRLALRLRLEADLVDLGVCVQLVRGSGVLLICVGAFTKDHDGYVLCQRSVSIPVGDTHDILLARVRAWKAVS